MPDNAYTARDWDSHPPLIDAGYKSTGVRGPAKGLAALPDRAFAPPGPRFGAAQVLEGDADLTRNGRVNGEPVGERIIVTGRVLDEFARPVPDTLVEIWQANSCGRYVHKRDQHDAPLDPNFLGSGRCASDGNGHYRFLTIKPGAYPWGNHYNAWRPNHIHLSLFGPGFATRLVTQMYFPGDPLLELDPIFLATPEHARGRLVARFDIDVTEEEYALGYRFDIVLRGADETPMAGDRP